MKNFVPIGLFVLYLIVFVICAISPYDRTVWWAENIPIILIVAAIIAISKYYRFSALSYLLMTCLIILHTIGGHYTFERVPFDFITKLFGFSRNHYDRLAHFTVGFYAYPIAEMLLAKKLVRAKWVLALFPIFSIFAVAGGYEIFEWLYAVSADSTAGIAVLGSQGDIWDAQKDMLSDVLGAVFAMMLFWLVFYRQIKIFSITDNRPVLSLSKDN
jgi:putative membrane protein